MLRLEKQSFALLNIRNNRGHQDCSYCLRGLNYLLERSRVLSTSYQSHTVSGILGSKGATLVLTLAREVKSARQEIIAFCVRSTAYN